MFEHNLMNEGREQKRKKKKKKEEKDKERKTIQKRNERANATTKSFICTFFKSI